MKQIPISDEELEKLSRRELIGLVKELFARIGQLEERIAELEAKLSSQLPPANSRNSSQPPSRDRKPNLEGRKKRRRMGARPGHQVAMRQLVDNPDRVIEVRVKQCANCHADLSGVEPDQVVRHQVTELPVVKPVVIETRIHEVECPHCHTAQRGRPPEGLEPTRMFGPRLEAAVIYYKQQQHLSYERLVETMRDLHGVELSEGGINAILRRAGEAARGPAAEIAEAVASSEEIASDETSARVKGRNGWEWVFRSIAGVVHVLAPTRGAKVIEEFMGDHRAECWSSDCYGAQLKAPANHRQLCLAHQIRNLERVIEQAPELEWPRRVQELFSEAIDLRNRFEPRKEMTLDGYLRRVTEIENRLDDLLSEDQTETKARKLYRRYVKHRDHLLYFLRHPEVEPTNNACEQALRPSVIHRKVTNGFRSEWGAKAYAALATVISTGKLQGREVFEILVGLMGTPVLPFLDTSDP